MVSRPEIQKFAGALQGKKAKKGIFIATSNFSDSAKEFVNNIDNKIVLVDGNMLTEYMMDHNIGVTNMTTYTIKRIDMDYFEE